MSVDSAAMSGELERALKDLWQPGADTQSTDGGDQLTRDRHLAASSKGFDVDSAGGSRSSESEATSGSENQAIVVANCFFLWSQAAWVS